VPVRPLHRQDEEREQQHTCRGKGRNVDPIRYLCSLFKSCAASVVCSLERLLNRDTPSEYVQSVEGLDMLASFAIREHATLDEERDGIHPPVGGNCVS
jgi:hypothetical protein